MRYQNSYQFPFASYPAVRIMLLMAAGILTAHIFTFPLSPLLFFFAGASAGWMVFEFVVRKKSALLSGHISALFYSLLVFSAPMVFVSLQNEQRLIEREKVRPLALYEWEDVTINGRIISSGKSSSGRTVLTVVVKKTTLPSGMVWTQSYKIRLYGDGDKSSGFTKGSDIKAEIHLYAFPERKNPHEFDYGNWLVSRGISAHGELQKILHVQKGFWYSWGRLRNAVLKKIDQLFDEDRAPLAKALLLGYKDDLAPDARQQFSRAGLSHIMAVSGLHVSFIVAPLWFFIPYLWGSKNGKWLGLLLLTLLLVSYAGLTGFSASVCRASLMAWLLTYGRLFYRVRNSVNLTAVAAVALLLINPQQLFNAGFQLSFSAVFILLLVMPEAGRLIPQKYQSGWTGGLFSILLVSVVVQIGLFPILIEYFGEFSIAGPVSNILVIPVLTVLVPAGLIITLSSFMMPVITQPVSVPLNYILQWIHEVASFAGGSRFSFITMDNPSFALFLIWLFAIFAIASLRIPNIRWKMLICLLIAMNVSVLERVMQKNEPGELEITFLDVGQGDAIHIKTPGNKHLLLDAGMWSPYGNSGKNVILPYLEEKGINRLNAILLSHPHADHIGGVPDILRSVQVDTIYQSDYHYNSTLYKTYIKLAAEKDIPVKKPNAGDIIHVDASIRLFVLGPGVNNSASNPNNRSLAFKLVYGDTSAIFSGDAEKEQERSLAVRYGDFLNSDLYKAGHHASNTSSTDQFLKFVKPKMTVASLAFENKFGHPGAQTVSRLHQYSKDQSYTSLAGAVVYHSDGKRFQKINWRESKF